MLLRNILLVVSKLMHALIVTACAQLQHYIIWSGQSSSKNLFCQLPVTLSYLPRCCSAYKYHYQAMNIIVYKFQSQYSEYLSIYDSIYLSRPVVNINFVELLHLLQLLHCYIVELYISDLTGCGMQILMELNFTNFNNPKNYQHLLFTKYECYIWYVCG